MDEYPEKDVELDQVQLNLITVGERFRRQYGDIESLKRSIESNGLIQPLAVERNGDGYTLLAGGRRYRAVSEMGWETVPVRIYPKELTKTRRLAIELSENLDREDMSWAERSRLEREIHLLYIQEYGEAKRTGKAGTDESTWSQAKTAKLLNKSQAQVSRSLKVAEALEAVPELEERCGSTNEAFKLLNKMGESMESLENLRAATERRDAMSEKSKKQELLDSYIIGDYLTMSKNAPDGCCDLIEIDPPYGIKLDDKKKGSDANKIASGLDGEYVEVDPDEYFSELVKYYERAYSLLKEDGWVIAWFAPEPWFENVHLALTAAGFKNRRMPCIWYKGQVGQTRQPSIYLPNSYEMFFAARKGKAEINMQGRSNVFHYRPVPPSKKIHPAERPIELIQDVLNTFIKKGSRVCVPFLGSGVTLLAADNLNIDGFGYDLSEEYKAKYNTRLETGGRPGFWFGYGQEA